MDIGFYGFLALLAWALVLPGLLPGARVLAVPGTVALVAWLAGAHEWRALRRWPTWLFLGGLAGLSALAAASPRAGLWLGLGMVARALAVLLAVDALATRVPIADLAALLERLGLPGLGFALGVALNTLPTLRRTAGSVWQALRMRGGPGRRPLLALRRYAVTTLALALAHGGEIVDAAESRAYQPGRGAALPRLRRGDVALMLVLIAWGLALVLA
jgi:energy-coupling factor transporter transmembrane protein EcfT